MAYSPGAQGETVAARLLEKRRRIMQWTYGYGGPPTGGASSTAVLTAADIIFAGRASGVMSGASRSYKLRFETPYPELYSVAHYHVPSSPCNPARGIVIHAGHELMYDDPMGDVASFFVTNGFHVISLAMPTFRPNPVDYPDIVPVTVALTDGTTTTVDSHNTIGSNLSTAGKDTRNPIRIYWDPPIRAQNYLRDTLGISRVYMTGLSGGGWTTHMIPIIDQRIKLSYPCAGFQPHELGNPTDWEQNPARAIYLVATVRELFALAAIDGRRVYQCLNDRDYNFWVHGPYEGDATYPDALRPDNTTLVNQYVADVQAILAGNGSWNLRVDYDTADQVHTISAATRAFILADILAHDP